MKMEMEVQLNDAPEDLTELFPRKGFIEHPEKNLEEWAFLRLDEPISYKGIMYPRLYLRPRYTKQKVGDIPSIEVHVSLVSDGSSDGITEPIKMDFENNLYKGICFAR